MPRDALLALNMLSSYVRLSHSRPYCIKTTGEMELVFGMNASFYLCYNYNVVAYVEIWVYLKITVLPSGNIISQTLGLDNFTTAINQTISTTARLPINLPKHGQNIGLRCWVLRKCNLEKRLDEWINNGKNLAIYRSG